MNLGERLKFARETANFSQLEVSKRTKIGNASLSNYENNYRKPTPEIIAMLASLYGVSTDYLLGITDYLTPHPNIRLTPLPSDSKDEDHFLLEVDDAIEIDKEILKAVAEQLPGLSEEEKKVLLPVYQGIAESIKKKKD